MLKIQCDMCQEELKEQGALLFSPPASERELIITYKQHICRKCYKELSRFIMYYES